MSIFTIEYSGLIAHLFNLGSFDRAVLIDPIAPRPKHFPVLTLRAGVRSVTNISPIFGTANTFDLHGRSLKIATPIVGGARNVTQIDTAVPHLGDLCDCKTLVADVLNAAPFNGVSGYLDTPPCAYSVGLLFPKKAKVPSSGEICVAEIVRATFDSSSVSEVEITGTRGESIKLDSNAIIEITVTPMPGTPMTAGQSRAHFVIFDASSCTTLKQVDPSDNDCPEANSAGAAGRMLKSQFAPMASDCVNTQLP